jgi:hypothetical protein
MKMTTATLSILLSALPVNAQTPSQNLTSLPTTTPVQSAAPSAAPCKATPATPRKPGYVEKKLKALACKQNKQLCDLPSSPSEITGKTPDIRPCPVITAATPPVSKTQATPAPPSAPATASSKPAPVYICPPKFTLVPGFPYCVNADHSSVVDAISLPASLSAPAPPASVAPAPAQH